MYPPLHKILRCRICFLMKQNPAKQDSPPAAGRASDILPFRCSAILAERFIVWKRSFLYDKIECALAHSRAEVRLLRQPSPFAPSAHPRGAFYPYRNKVSYTIKKQAGPLFQNVLPAVSSECFLPALNRPCRFFEPCRLFFVQIRRHFFAHLCVITV